jgi:16S rRNA (cytidine1402-2'-O)-methyltransferase
MAGTLFVVATPIGNLEDISPRAVAVLRQVALIAAEDTRHTAHLLQRFGVQTRTTSFHEHSPREKADDLIARLLSGDDIALVSDAGTPVVSDPGEQLVRLAHAAGIRVEPVPGPSAAVAAVSASGMGARGFVFLGFPPTKGAERTAWFERLRAAGAVAPAAVFYEAPHRIERTLADLRQQLGNVEICLCRELTKAHEEVRVGPLDEVRPSSLRGEFTVVVNCGQSTNQSAGPDSPDAKSLADEFGDITQNKGLTRRQAIAELSRKYKLPARQVFAMLDEAKSSVV